MDIVELFEKDAHARKRLAELLVSDEGVKLAIINAVLRDVATKQDLEKLRNELRNEFNERFRTLESRLDRLEDRVGRLEDRVESIEQSVHRFQRTPASGGHRHTPQDGYGVVTSKSCENMLNVINIARNKPLDLLGKHRRQLPNN